eukprot:Skav204516  [mRNA]  locus=scaffold3201:106418:123439:+ [translate_table: standard]
MDGSCMAILSYALTFSTDAAFLHYVLSPLMPWIGPLRVVTFDQRSAMQKRSLHVQQGSDDGGTCLHVSSKRGLQLLTPNALFHPRSCMAILSYALTFSTDAAFLHYVLSPLMPWIGPLRVVTFDQRSAMQKRSLHVQQGSDDGGTWSIDVNSSQWYWNRMQYRHRFDVLSISVLMTTQLFAISYDHAPDWLVRTVLVAHISRGICLMQYIAAFRYLLALLGRLLPVYYRLGLLLLMVFYIFTTIGEQIFGGRMLPADLEGSGYAAAQYWPLNFDDFPSGLVTLFCIMVINNWFVVAGGFMQVTTPYASLFFVLFFVIVNLIVLNILIALIIDTSAMVRDEIVLEECRAREAKQEEDGSEAEDDPLEEQKHLQHHEGREALLQRLLLNEETRVPPVVLNGATQRILEGPRRYDPEVEIATETHWQRLIQSKPQLFDGPVWCLRSFALDGGTVVLDMQESSYKYSVYTHHTPEGQLLDFSRRSGACGLMSLTETKDGLLVFGKRSRYVGAFAGFYHCVPAGIVDVPDLQKVISKELEEEVGADWTLVESCNFMALMDTGQEQGHKYEFLLSMKLSLTAEEVHHRYQSAFDKKEHEEFLFIRPHATTVGSAGARLPTVGIAEFLSGTYQITDVARRSLLLLQELPEASVNAVSAEIN